MKSHDPVQEKVELACAEIRRNVERALAQFTHDAHCRFAQGYDAPCNCYYGDVVPEVRAALYGDIAGERFEQLADLVDATRHARRGMACPELHGYPLRRCELVVGHDSEHRAGVHRWSA